MFDYLQQLKATTRQPFSAVPNFSIEKIGTWLSTVLQSSLDSVIVIDDKCCIQLLNREAGRLFGYPIKQLPGQPLHILFPASCREEQSTQLIHIAAARISTGRRLRIKLDLQGLRANGEPFLFSAAIARVTISDKVFLAMILRELITQSLPEIMNSLPQTTLRKLALSSQQASEIEKRRFSKELYDELGQSLSVLKLDLDWLENSSPDNKNISQRISQMQSLLNDILVRTKNIATTLRPSLLDDFGLVPAVEWMATSFFKRTGIRCVLVNDGVPNKPGDQVESAVFRILQESLLNIERHAQASHVTIHLWYADQHLHMAVLDNGIGLLDADQKKPGCHGLSVMQERIYTLGGTLSIKNNEICGLEIHAAIPCQF